MRISRKKFSSAVLLFLVAGLLCLQTNAQFCKIINEENLRDSTIFVSTNEDAEFFLDDWFEGTNLTFSLSSNDQFNPIEQPLNMKGKSQYMDTYDSIIDTDFYQKSNGNSLYSMLYTDYVDSAQQDQQYVVFGAGDNDTPFPFDFNNRFEIPESKGLLVKCLDILSLDENRVLLDCIKRGQIKGEGFEYLDKFFILNRNAKSFSMLEFNPNVTDGIDSRRSELYQNEGYKMIIQGNFEDEFYEPGINFPKISVYVYDQKTSPGFPEGTLEKRPPITFSDFGFEEDANFQPTDFDVFGDRIYVVEKFFGILSFKYDGNKVVKTSIVRKSFSSLLIDWKEAWAISLSAHGAFTQVVLIGREQLLVARFMDISENVYYSRQFDLPFISLGTPEVQSDARYVLVRAGQLLAVYDTGDKNSNQFHSVLRGAESFELLSSNLLHVYYSSYYVSYVIQEPILEFDGTILESNSTPSQITITAESRYFTKTQTCSLTLWKKVVLETQLGPIAKTSTSRYTYEFEDSLERDIYLDEQFAGPNLVYQVRDAYNSLHSKNVPNAEDLIELDTPTIVELKLDPEVDQKDEIYSKILNVFNTRHLQLRQLSNYSVIVHECVTYFEDKALVSCMRGRIRFNFTGKILLLQEGQIDDNILIGMVTENAKDQIVFSDLNGILQNLKFQEAEIGPIKDLVITNQLLYVLGENYKIGLYKIFKSKIEKIVVLDDKYVQDWKLTADEPWQPTKLNVHFSLKNFLFVELKNSAVVVSIEDDHLPVFVSQIIADPVRGYRGFLSPRSYSILSQNDGTITEYSLSDITNAQRTNSFQKYGFSYYRDAAKGAVIANFTHNLYVLGYASVPNQQEKQPALLVYKTQANNFEQLYSAVMLPGLTKAQLDGATSIQLSVDGRESLDFVLLNVDGLRFLIRVPVRARLIVLPEETYPKFQYASYIDFNYQVSGMNTSRPTERLQKKIVFINPQNQLFRDEDEINKSEFSLGIELTSQKEFAIPLQSESWYNGPVLSKSLSCEDCLGDGSGQRLIRIRNKVQELDSTQIPLTKDIRDLDQPPASLFFGPEEKLFFVTEQEELIHYSPETLDAITVTDLGLNPVFDECFQLLSCQNDTNILFQDNLFYVAAICKSGGNWVVSVVQQFLNEKKAELKGVFTLKEAHKLIDAKCLDSKLYFLDQDTDKKTSSLFIYNLFQDVASAQKNLSLLANLTAKDFALSDSTPFTSFDVVKIGKTRKIVLTESVRYLVVAEFEDATNTVAQKDGKPIVERLDTEKQLTENICYVRPGQALLNVKVLRDYQRKSADETREYVHALLVIENSPIYQIELVLKKQDPTFLLEEWIIYKVYQNYGDHKVQAKLSIQEGYFAATFVDPSKLYTVVVYQIQNDISRAGNDAWQPAFEPIWGGRQFEVDFQALEFAYVVYYKQQPDKKQYGLIIPAPNSKDATTILEINEEDFIVTSPALARSQELQLTLESQFVTKNNKNIYGFIEPIGQFDVKPYCLITSDQYSTPSLLLNADLTREEYLLTGVFRGFNLSYSLSASNNSQGTFSLEGAFSRTMSLPIKGGRQTVVASDQIVDSSGFTTLARLSLVRFQESFDYQVSVVQEKGTTLNFEALEPIEIDTIQEISCLDIEFITHRILIVYCVREEKTIFRDKYYDYFITIDLDDPQNIRQKEGLELRMNGTITSGKIMFYDDPRESSVSYLVTAPFFDSRPSGSLVFDDYVRIYQFFDGQISWSNYSTIVLKDVLGTDLTLADFDVLDNVIYLLDYRLGLFSFTFDYQSATKNQTERFQKQGIFPNHVKGFNYRDGFGLDVDYDGAEIMIVIAESDRVLLFHQNRGNFIHQPILISTFDSDFQLKNRPEVQATNKFIGVRSGQIVTIYRKDLSHHSIAVFEDAYDFNLEFQETLFLWSRERLLAYTLQTPYLWVKSVDTTRLDTELNITVTSNNTILGQEVNCTIRLSSREVDRNSMRIYNTKTESNVYAAENPFEDKNIPIDLQIVGPNIDFDLIEIEDESRPDRQQRKRRSLRNILGEVIDDRFDLEYETPVDCFYDKVELDSKQTIFSRMIAIDNSQFILVHQLADYSLLFRRCIASVGIYTNIQCKNITINYDLNSTILQFVGGFYGGFPTIVIVQSSQPDTLQLYSDFGLRTRQTKFENQTISSLVLNNQLLFFISNKQVFVIDTANSEDTKAIISESSTKPWKISSFDPIELEAHSQDGNILVIRQIDTVLLVSVEQKTPILINQFGYSQAALAGEICESHLAPHAFVVACGKTFISTFSLLNLRTVTPLNVFSTYRFKPLQVKNQPIVVVGNYSGLLYVLAEDSENETYLLVYRSHSQHIRSLYKAIELPSTEFKGTEPLQITASGYTHTDYVYISIGAREYFFRIPHNHQIRVRPGWLYPITTYTHEFRTKFEAIGMDLTIDTNVLKETLIVQFYNPQTRLLVDQDAIDNSGISENDGLEMESEGQSVFPIPTETYIYGPNVGFNLSCIDCVGGVQNTGIISIENKVQDISDQYKDKLAQLDEIQGSFQGKNNKNLYLLNNKYPQFVQKIGFEISPATLRLKVSDDALCVSYLPCYGNSTEDNYVLNYTIAICQEGSNWVVAPVDYSSVLLPLPLPQILLPEVESFVQAQCVDKRLLVMDTKVQYGESVIYVYNIFDEIRDGNKNATVVQIYDSKSLALNDTVESLMTSFEVTKVNDEKFRRIFISLRKNLVTSLLLHTDNYTLILFSPVPQNILINQRFKNRKLYFPGEDIEIVSVRVLSSQLFNKSSEGKTTERFLIRILLVLRNLPMAEFIIDSPLTRDPQDLTIDHFSGLYDHVGDAEVSGYLSITEQEFVAQFYNAKKDALIFALYRISQEINFEDGKVLSYNHIIGGYNLKDINFYQQNFPVPVLLYSKDPVVIVDKREVRALIPSPQSFEAQAKLFEVQDSTYIIAKNSNFYSQNFELIPDSVYAKPADSILGIITPFDPLLVEIDTEPYCRILDEKFEQRFKLWNSINKTEQYLLDQIIEGYNLSFILEDPLDFTTKYQVFDTLQEMDRTEFKKEDIKEVVDIASLQQIDDKTKIIRLGVKVHQEKAFYALTFFDGKESVSPKLRQLINIEVNQDVSCFSVAFISKTDAVLYCNEFVTTTQKAYAYQDVFFVLQEVDETFSTIRRQVNRTFTLDAPIESSKTVAYTNAQTSKIYLVSAPLLVPRSEIEIQKSTYLSVYEYQPASRTVSVPVKFNLTEADFGLTEPLMLTDIQVFNNRIYVLDLTQGLFSFEFDPNLGVQKLQMISLVGHGIRFSWGLYVKQYSAFTGIYISTRTELLHFVQPFGNFTGDMVLRHRYPLEDELIARPVVQSSGKYVGIQIKSVLTIYERGQSNSQKVFRNLPKIQGFNLFQDNYLYVWQKHAVISYLLEQPHLYVRALNESGIKVPILTAISWNRFLDKNQTCQITFNPKNIPANSVEVRDVFSSGEPLFETGSSLEKNIFLDQHYAGPNLGFETEMKWSAGGLSADQLQIDLDIPEEVDFSYPVGFVKESVFDRIIQVTDFEQIQIHQTPSFLVQLLSCNTTFKDISSVSCKLIKNLTDIQSKITVFTHGLYKEEPSFLIVQKNFPNRFYQYLYNGNLLGNRALSGVTNILDLELALNTLYVLDSQTNSSVRIYSTLIGNQPTVLSVIDSKYANQWGIDPSQFLPLSINTHYNYPDLLLIEFEDQLAVVSTQTSQPELISLYQIPTYGVPHIDHFVLTANYLWNIRQNGIFIHDTRDEEKLQLLYALENYTYSFVVPTKTGFQFTTVHPSNFIYVVAQSTAAADLGEIILLVYRETAQNIQNLYTAFRTGIKYNQETSSITLAADSSVDVDFVLLNIDGKIFTIRVPHHPNLLIQPGELFPRKGYSSNLSVSFQVTSMDGQISLRERLDIIFVNTQTEVFENKAAIENATIRKEKGGVRSTGDTEQEIELDTDNWYSGPVLSYELECPACETQLSEGSLAIRNKIQQNSSKSLKDQLEDLENIGGSFTDAKSGRIFFLSGDYLQIYSPDFILLSETLVFKNGKSNERKCYQLLPSYSTGTPGNLVFAVAICEQKGQLIAAPVNVTDVTSPNKNTQIIQLNRVSGFVEAQCFNEDLLVLQNDPTGPSITAYDLVADIIANRNNATVIRVMDIYYFLTITLNGQITSFNAIDIPNSQDSFKLLITQENNMLVVAGMKHKTYNIQFLNLTQRNVEVFDIRSELSNKGIYIKQQWKTLSVKAINETSTKTADEILVDVDVLLMIENSPIIELSLTIYEDLQEKIQKNTTIELNRLFSQYGDGILQRHFSYTSDFLAACYYSLNSSSFTIVVYDDSKPKSLEDSQQIPSVPITGGVDQFAVLEKGQVIPTVFFVLFKNSTENYNLIQPSIFTEEPSKLFNFRNKTTLVIKNNKFGEQEFRIIPQSDYTKSRQYVTGYAYPKTKPQKDSYDYTWVIIVSVIGGVAILGGLGYYFWRKRKEQGLLDGDEAASDGGMSLQEQINQRN